MENKTFLKAETLDVPCIIDFGGIFGALCS